jgi:hypothetical protein
MNVGPALQSSTDWEWGGPAELASDLNMDGNFHNGSATHTLSEVEPFWQTATTFDNPKVVVIYNRTDCCRERLGRFMVSFWRERHRAWIQWGPWDMQGRDKVELRVPDNNRWGAVDAIRITKLGTGILSLAEVVVMAR